MARRWHTERPMRQGRSPLELGAAFVAWLCLGPLPRNYHGSDGANPGCNGRRLGSLPSCSRLARRCPALVHRIQLLLLDKRVLMSAPLRQHGILRVARLALRQLRFRTLAPAKLCVSSESKTWRTRCRHCALASPRCQVPGCGNAGVLPLLLLCLGLTSDGSMPANDADNGATRCHAMLVWSDRMPTERIAYASLVSPRRAAPAELGSLCARPCPPVLQLMPQCREPSTGNMRCCCAKQHHSYRCTSRRTHTPRTTEGWCYPHLTAASPCVSAACAADCGHS